MIPPDFRQGRWQDVMADIGSVDIICTDPPYSERTHAGFRTGKDLGDGGLNNTLNYNSLSLTELNQAAAYFVRIAKQWVIVFGDDKTTALWLASFEAAGWQTFAPVVWLKTDATPRFSGDGPQSSAEYLSVARPRRRVRDVRSRPGYYIVRGGSATGGISGVIGTKDVSGLVRLLSDYSRPGDLVADPFGGSASMGEACVRTGRRYVGAECDPATWAIGRRRLDLALADPVVHDRWAQGRQRALFPADRGK